MLQAKNRAGDITAINEDHVVSWEYLATSKKLIINVTAPGVQHTISDERVAELLAQLQTTHAPAPKK